MRNQYQLLRERGAKIGFITEITKQDIPYCKEAMKFTEIRHLEGIRGNFAVHDGIEYTAIAVLEKTGSPTQRLIYSNVKEIVEQHQYLFETLWNKAIPAEQKIREIEEGIIPDFIETISNPRDIQQLQAKLVNLAEQDYYRLRMYNKTIMLYSLFFFNRLSSLKFVSSVYMAPIF